MNLKQRVLFFAAILSPGVGCGGEDQSAGGDQQNQMVCTEGASQQCSCADGRMGAAVCSGGILQACNCTGGQPGPSTCGNGAIDPGELCDGANFGGETCASVTMMARPNGTLLCSGACSIDTSACTGGMVDPGPGGMGGLMGVGGNTSSGGMLGVGGLTQ